MSVWSLQCENKETFIQQIRSLDIETQAAIASCIQQVEDESNHTPPPPPRNIKGSYSVLGRDSKGGVCPEI